MKPNYLDLAGQTDRRKKNWSQNRPTFKIPDNQRLIHQQLIQLYRSTGKAACQKGRPACRRPYCRRPRTIPPGQQLTAGRLGSACPRLHRKSPHRPVRRQTTAIQKALIRIHHLQHRQRRTRRLRRQIIRRHIHRYNYDSLRTVGTIMGLMLPDIDNS